MSCENRFESSEPLHPGATFICKKHPRTEQVRATGRKYDKKQDEEDTVVRFQDSQFCHDNSLKTSTLHGVENAKDRKPFRTKHTGHKESNDKQLERNCEVSHLRSSMSEEQMIRETNIAKNLLSRNARLVEALGRNPNDEFETELLGTLYHGAVGQLLKPQSVYLKKHGRPQDATDRTEAYEKDLRFPDFTGEVRRFKASSISGNKVSEINNVWLATFGTTLAKSGSNRLASAKFYGDYKVQIEPLIKMGMEQFHTVRDTTINGPNIEALVRKLAASGKMKRSIDSLEYPESAHSGYVKFPDGTRKLVTVNANNPTFRETAIQLEQQYGDITWKEAAEKMKNIEDNDNSKTEGAAKMRRTRLTKKISEAKSEPGEEFINALDDRADKLLWEEGGIFLPVRHEQQAPRVYPIKMPTLHKVYDDGSEEPVWDSEVMAAAIDLVYTRLVVKTAEKAGRRAANGINDAVQRQGDLSPSLPASS